MQLIAIYAPSRRTARIDVDEEVVRNLSPEEVDRVARQLIEDETGYPAASLEPAPDVRNDPTFRLHWGPPCEEAAL